MLGFQQLLQIGIEFCLGGEFGRMIPALSLRKIAVHHGQLATILEFKASADQAPLRLLIIARKAARDGDGLLFAEQGDPIVRLLAVEVDVITHGFDIGARKGIVMHLDLLQPYDIGVVGVDERLQLRQSCA